MISFGCMDDLERILRIYMVFPSSVRCFIGIEWTDGYCI